MTDIFNKAIEQVLKSEGGYANNPSDKGGPTKYGITQAVARKHGYKGNMKNFPLEVAKEIYKKDYWQGGMCDKILEDYVAFLHFDACVNHGIKNATIILQRALNTLDCGLKVDGIFGPKTLDAVNNSHMYLTIESMTAERLKFYISLSTFIAFGKGWVRRVADNLEFIKTL